MTPTEGTRPGPTANEPSVRSGPAATAARPKMLLDCDPGHDDAVAIITAARHADLVGITTVAGNAPLDSTTYNARVMRDLLGIDVPIHSGCDRPLEVEPVSGDYIHGESGLDGADLPPPVTPLDGDDAVSFIIETCRASEGVWLVPTGPLTNIARALDEAPDIADRAAGISLMGAGPTAIGPPRPSTTSGPTRTPPRSCSATAAG